MRPPDIAINLTSKGTEEPPRNWLNETMGGAYDLTGNMSGDQRECRGIRPTVAVNAVLTGNVIANDVLATIDDST